MKKIFGIFGIILIMLMATVSFPVFGETDETETIGRTHIIAIGWFSQCEVNQIVHGRVLIGLIGLGIVVNQDIEFCMGSIKWIVMTNHFLNCVIEG